MFYVTCAHTEQTEVCNSVEEVLETLSLFGDGWVEMPNGKTEVLQTIITRNLVAGEDTQTGFSRFEALIEPPVPSPCWRKTRSSYKPVRYYWGGVNGDLSLAAYLAGR